MRHFIEANPQICYFGGDIVASIIEPGIVPYKAGNVRPAILEITTNDLPDADLLILGDCLFHRSFGHIARDKANITGSNIKYLLTTTHIVDQGFINSKIVTGDFRLNDIFDAPLSSVGPLLERTSECTHRTAT